MQLIDPQRHRTTGRSDLEHMLAGLKDVLMSWLVLNVLNVVLLALKQSIIEIVSCPGLVPFLLDLRRESHFA